MACLGEGLGGGGGGHGVSVGGPGCGLARGGIPVAGGAEPAGRAAGCVRSVITG
ncbi:unnamed protein product [[Actinomadura] parvosata subsp. kistnae]|nr:unnamed protein product [Actinomadura parvosata subsp. kistnae]